MRLGEDHRQTEQVAATAGALDHPGPLAAIERSQRVAAEPATAWAAPFADAPLSSHTPVWSGGSTLR